MRLLLGAALLALFSATCHAQLSQINYPPCAVTCATEYFVAAGCSSIDCICTNPQLTSNITTCALASCSVKDQIKTHEIIDSICMVQPRDDSQKIIIAAAVTTGLAFVSVGMRFASKWPAFSRTLGWDDYVILAATMFAIPVTVLDILMAKYGLGEDYWTVSSVDSMVEVLHLLFLAQPFYLLVGALTKISILCFYLRIFPSQEFGRLCKIIIAVCAAFAVTFILVLIFQCHPISYAWNIWDGAHSGQCINANAVGWTQAAINILLDLLIVVLPLPSLWGLNLSTRKKVHVFLMFGVGVFVTIVSILRLRYLVEFARSDNPTWDYLPYALWSTIEIYIGIVCACMPSMRAFLRRVLPPWLGGTTQNTSHPSANTSRSRITKTIEVSTIELTERERANFVTLDDEASDYPIRSPPHSRSRRENWE